MTLDLTLWASSRDDLLAFAESNNLLETVDNQDGTTRKVTRRGLEFIPWNGTGSLITKLRDVQITRTVDVVQDGIDAIPAIPEVLDIDGNVLEPAVPGIPGIPAEFAFDIGNNTPAWLDETVTAWDGLEFRGRYNRKQGNFAVFSGTADVGETLDISVVNVTTLPGFIGLLKFHSKVAEEDELKAEDLPEGETIEDLPEGEWRKSKIARFIRRNGTLGTVGGLNYYDINGVRIFKYEDVLNWCATRGIPGHIFL